MDRVAAEGGIAKMTLYRHFPSKEALFEGLVAAMCAEMRQGIESAPSADAGQPCRERLADELRAFTSTLIEPDALALYRLVVAEGWRLPSVARVFDESGMRVIRLRLAALLETGGTAAKQSWYVAGEVVALALGDAYQRAILGIAQADDDEAFVQQIEVAVAHAFSNASGAPKGGGRAGSKAASKKLLRSRK